MIDEARYSVPCSGCEVPLQRGLPDDCDDYPADGPLRQPTPLLRVTAMAQDTGMILTVIPADDTGGLAGAIGVGVDEAGRLRAVVGLADDLDEDLRIDVIAFAVALFVGAPKRLIETPDGRIGLGRERLPSASGPGHLAFHMAYSCGRDTPSATFELVPI
jgi:hypothetical protein